MCEGGEAEGEDFGCGVGEGAAEGLRGEVMLVKNLIDAKLSLMEEGIRLTYQV